MILGDRLKIIKEMREEELFIEFQKVIGDILLEEARLGKSNYRISNYFNQIKPQIKSWCKKNKLRFDEYEMWIEW